MERKKKQFFDWLEYHVKPELLTRRYIDIAWEEALEADLNGQDYEIPSWETIIGNPVHYRVS